MDILIFFFFCFFFLSSFVFVNVEASCVSDCQAIKCSDDSPVIQFPFRACDDQQQIQQYCGLPGFEISCKQNKSLIHFRSYGSLEVKSISYESKSISLLDPNNCVHEVFLNLNLSDTPFKYSYVLKEYRYLNCSENLPIPFTQVPCLSAPGSHIYIVEPSLSIPDSCKPLKSIGIPFSYSPYISDKSFGLRFSWDSTNQEKNETIGLHLKGQSETAEKLKRWIDIIYYKALAFAMFIFMVVTLAFLKTSYLEDDGDQNHEEFKKRRNTTEAQRLLGDDCEILELPGQSKASIKILIDQDQTTISTRENCEVYFSE